MKKHFHFVGIKGVGMAPLAIIAKEAGFIVTGSDIADGFITDAILAKHGIVSLVGFDPLRVKGVDIVITTGAHGGYDNPEVIAAKENGIVILTQGQAVGEFMKGEILDRKQFIGISIAGTHGKTTTTAMIASLLQQAHLDPTWIVGTSEIPSLGDGGHFNKGNYFVAEADEYANEPTYDKTPKMLLQHPTFAVITNIEHDHPDVYPTLQSAYDAFLQFAQLLPTDGLLVACGDDTGVKDVLKKFSGNSITYGKGEKNTYQIKNITKNHAGVIWDVISLEEKVTLSLSLPGEHNAYNATAAYIIAKNCLVATPSIQKALESFSGTKRRMEYVGQLASGALLYDDYAHHPTEIEKTLTALKEKYTDSHIVCIFQPHTYSRTKLLFEQFVSSLSLADEIILSDIYSSQREAYDPSVSSEHLAQKIRQKKPVVVAKTLSDVVKYIGHQHYEKNTIILTMGAGDIYQVAKEILEH